MSECCGTCRFWRLRSDPAKDLGGGYCVRFPPMAPAGYQVWAEARGFYVAPDSNLNDAWPNTSQQSWCGEFQPAGRAALSALEEGEK